MKQQEKHMDEIEIKKGNFLCDLTSKAYQHSLAKTSADVCHQLEFSENLDNNKENSNDLYSNDEESMIPKGLLDQPYDKLEEHYRSEVTTSTPNTHMLSYGIPCYIAVFPQPAERQINYNQFNGSSYFPNETSYTHPSGNDYIQHNQRDLRTFNNSQYNRNYQGIDYNWWGHGRQNHISYIPNTNIEMRAGNIQRNLGMAMTERFYDQQPIIHEHPYEYHQRDLGYKTHFSYGYDNNYLNATNSQPSFTKNFCRNQSKYRREFQQPQDSSMCLKNIYIHDIHPNENNHGVNLTNITIPKHEEITKNPADHEQLMSCLNVYNIKYKSNDLNTFKKIALDGCLQLEKLLATNSKSSAKNLEELCRSVKSQLSHSINTIQTELIIRELILGFLHICNSWICISSIITMKQGQNISHESNLQSLLVDFENWQNTSKTLLEKLLVVVQGISIEHEQYVKDIYKGTIITKGAKESEKVQIDVDEYKKDILNNDLKQMQHYSSSPSLNNESFNSKQTSAQWCESNSSLFKNSDKSYTINGYMLPKESQNIHQNSSSSLIQNTVHEYSTTKQQTFYQTHCSFSSIIPENMTVGNKTENDGNKITEENLTNFPLHKKNNPLSKKDMVSCVTSKHSPSFSSGKCFSYNQENIEKHSTPVQPEVISGQRAMNESNNLKSDNAVNYKITVLTENKCNEEEKELKNTTNNEVNQNYQISQERYNFKYNRKKSLKNKICNFSKNYSKPADDVIYTEQIFNIKTYSKSKLQEIFSSIQGADLEKFVTQRISDKDITKIRQSITYPLFSISYSVNKDCYQNLNDVLDDLYKLFFKAKCENKGNITLLTVANRLELKLINMMFEEIGIC